MSYSRIEPLVRSGSNDYATSGTAATVTLAASTSGERHIIRTIAWSYSGTPTGGALTITDGGATVWSVDITAGGPGCLSPELVFASNSAVVVTLASAGVTGKINVASYKVKY